MTQETRVAVIDDDKLSSYNLNVKLKFIGEKPANLTSENWRHYFASESKKQRVFALIIGNLEHTSLDRLLEDIRAVKLELPIILAGPQTSFDTLDDRHKQGIIAVHERPISYQVLVDSLNLARQKSGLSKPKMSSLLISETGTAMFRSLVGQSRRIQTLREMLEQLENSLVTVLITGESGTGKEIVARNLHYHSGRGQAPFISVNCAGLSPELFARELFGCEEVGGETVAGHLENAAGGTLYLDVIDEMPGAVQARLLRFLEQRTFERIGGRAKLSSEVRLIAATHTDLEARIARHQFREDLYYRLNIMPLQMPALRERVEDIPDLLQELVARLENTGSGSIRFNSAAVLSLQRHAWPGNVRELANLVERLAILRGDAIIGVRDLPANYQHVSEEEIAGLDAAAAPAAHPAEEYEPSSASAEPGEARPEPATSEEREDEKPPGLTSLNRLEPLDAERLRGYLASSEKNLLEVALEDCDGRVSLAAERLQITAEALQEKMQHFGLATES